MAAVPSPSPFARILGALKVGAGAVVEVASAARNCRCVNCRAPVPVARSAEEQQRLCDTCRDKGIDAMAAFAGNLIKRTWPRR